MTVGRPRKPETDQAILGAALDLFSEAGYEGMSVEAVAARAGVGKATIYRRWSSKDDLIIAAIQDVFIEIDGSLTGEFRRDLVTMIGAAINFMQGSAAGMVFPRMAGEVAEGTMLGQRYVEMVLGPRRQLVRAMLQSGIDRGELRSDLGAELMADMLMGPIILRKILRELGGNGEELAEVLIDSLLEGWRA